MKRVALIALAALVLMAAPVAHAENARIGVILPLTGPAARAGQQALAVLEKKFDKKLLLIVDSGGMQQGAAAALKTVQERKVTLVIGPLLSTELQAVFEAKSKVPVASLVLSLTQEASRKAFKAQVLTFTQSKAQFSAVFDPKRIDGKFVVASTDFFAPKADQIASLVSKNAVDKRGVSSPLSKAQAEDLVKIAIDQKATFASFADDETAATLQQGLTSRKGKGIIMSPPSPQYTAEIVSNLVLDWLRQKERTPSSWLDIVTQSKYFDKESTSIPVDWNVTARGIDLVAYATTSGTKTCRCSSKDGTIVRSEPCEDPPNACKTPTQTETDCTCPCGPK